METFKWVQNILNMEHISVDNLYKQMTTKQKERNGYRATRTRGKTFDIIPWSLCYLLNSYYLFALHKRIHCMLSTCCVHLILTLAVAWIVIPWCRLAVSTPVSVIVAVEATVIAVCIVWHPTVTVIIAIVVAPVKIR